MKQTTQRKLRAAVADGTATDITWGPVPDRLTVLELSHGIYGVNGALLADRDGNKYAVTKRTTTLFKVL